MIDTLDPAKDIDGLHPRNAGLLTLGYEGFLPTTAHAAVEILKRSDIPLAGRRVTVVGRSNVVGKPAALLLLRENATVTLCHSKTVDLARHTREARDRGRRDRRPGPDHRGHAEPGRGRRGRGHQRRGRQARRRRGLRVGEPVASAITPGPGRRRAGDQRPPAHPPRPRGAGPGLQRIAPRPRCSSPGVANDLHRAVPLGPRDRPRDDAAPDPRGRPGPGPRGRRGRAVRRDQGEGHARGDPPRRGREPARQVRRRDGDQPDAAGRGQVHDDGRPRAGPQPDRPAGRGHDPPAVARAGVRDQGRRGRRRLQPGHPDGGLQPPPDRRRPRDRRRAQPGRGVHRQPRPPRQRARDRPARDPVAAGRSTSATGRCERSSSGSAAARTATRARRSS